MTNSFFNSMARLLNAKFSQQTLLVAYIAIMVTLSIFPEGLESRHFGVSLSESPEKLSAVFGYTDAGSYLNAAMELNNSNLLTQNQHWVINLWPPGMVLLDAYLLRYFGMHFAIAYAISIGFIWTFMTSIFTLRIYRKYGPLLAFLSATILIVCSPLQIWIFDFGLFYAEGVSMAAFLLGLVLLLRGSQTDSNALTAAHGIGAGTALAVAAYFRSTFSTLEMGLLGISIVLLIFLAFKRITRKEKSSQVNLRKNLLLIGSGWLSMFTLMEPWLQFTTNSIRETRAWSVVSAIFVRNIWVERQSTADFMQDGGVGWGCEIDSEFCSQVMSLEKLSGVQYPLGEMVVKTIKAVISNPVAYIADRFHFISVGWFSDEASMGKMSLVWGFVLLVGFILTTTILLRMASKGDISATFILLACVLLTAPALVGHIEPRYFIPLKLMFFIVPWLKFGRLAGTKPIGLGAPGGSARNP